MTGRRVESTSNPAVTMLRDLRTREGRRKHGAFLVEGTRLVSEAAAAGWKIPILLFDEKRAREDPELGSLALAIPGALPTSERALRAAADTVTPQGIVAAAAIPAPPDGPQPAERLVLILDGLADPGNAGTLLRSAWGAGVRTVLCTRGTVDLFSPKVVRGGMGAHFRLHLAQDLSWPEVERLLGPARTIVLAEAFAPRPYHRYNWRQAAALVVGSEARGPGPDASARAAERVSIPVEKGTESLNAGVAGSIIMFEARRQRETSTP